MARIFSLSSIKAGITRLRTKGGASKDSLYDLVNAHVTVSGSIEPRDSTTWDYTLPAGTKGMASFEDKLHVFAHEPVVVANPLFVVNTLRHPTDASQALHKIHFAKPIMRGLYVAAEFVNGDVFHYWIQRPSTWSADTAFSPGGLVAPSVPNGFLYRAARLDAPNVLWAANVLRAVGDKIEPTVANGFYYLVTDVDGATPKSGDVEPAWPTSEGASIRESSDSPAVPPPETAPAVPGGGTSGGIGGDGTDYDRCAIEDTWLSDELQVKNVTVGSTAQCYSPYVGHFIGTCVFVGERILQPCVQLVADNGCTKTVSKTTPVNFAEAQADISDAWAYAPNMRGNNILTERGPSRVVDVIDVGEKWVIPLSYGGVSFLGGDTPDNRLFTHNIRKGP